MSIKKFGLMIIVYAGLLNLSVMAQLNHVTGTPDGFASLNGGTTGGEGGTVVTVSNATELKENLDNTATLIILVDSTITIDSEISCRGNKTIVGLGTNARIKGGGLAWNTKTNVILQNLIFEGSGDDMIKINNNCENIWVDHCTIRDSETGILVGVDGGLDITRASRYITVSYCHFYNHDKNMLIGHADGNTQDTAIKVTIHHCFFDGTIQRNPRVRYGTVHCYNNYYLHNTTYGIASACDANVLVENCYFRNMTSPVIVGVLGYSPAGWLVERGSIFENCGTPQTKVKEMDFTEYYSYNLDSACMVSSIAVALAGCGKPLRSDTTLSYPECSQVQSPDTSDTTAVVTTQLNNLNSEPGLSVLTDEIQFKLNSTCPVEITIYEMSGRLVAIPFRGWVKEGVNYIIAYNSKGLLKGIYICKLRTSNSELQQKFIIR